MFTDKYSGQHFDGGPSMLVVHARMKAATGGGKCKCGKLRDPSEIKRIGSRSWVSCLRCLGQIKQLS